MAPVAAISQQIWEMKYRFKEAGGTIHDKTIPDSWRRVAGALAAQLAPLTGDMLTMADIAAAETRLLALSDAIGQRYFLQLRKTQSADILA